MKVFVLLKSWNYWLLMKNNRRRKMVNLISIPSRITLGMMKVKFYQIMKILMKKNMKINIPSPDIYRCSQNASIPPDKKSMFGKIITGWYYNLIKTFASSGHLMLQMQKFRSLHHWLPDMGCGNQAQQKMECNSWHGIHACETIRQAQDKDLNCFTFLFIENIQRSPFQHGDPIQHEANLSLGWNLRWNDDGLQWWNIRVWH